MIYRGAITLDKRKDTRCSLDGLNSQDVKRSIRERKKDLRIVTLTSLPTG